MIDLEKILTPISDKKPTGDFLPYLPGDTSFDDLNELRAEMSPAEDPAGVGKIPNWKAVYQESEKILVGKSKDLELAAILTQGLVYQEGFAGLQSGLGVFCGLLETFWPDLHPGVEDGELDFGTRAAPLTWIGSSKPFLLAVKLIPITAPIGGEAQSWLTYEQDNALWQTSLSATPNERLDSVQQALNGSLTEFNRLKAICADKFTEAEPFLLDLGQLLDEVQEYLGLVSESGTAPEASESVDDPTVEAASSAAAQPAANVGGGPVASRDDAYRKLREIADYLRKIEPHSPVPSLLDRAIRWGGLSFENLFDDVVKNAEVRNQTKDLLGLDPNQGP